ncbi:MAG: outer membrane lipoprotein carrier protein LolA [Planctomycetota bacterium]
MKALPLLFVLLFSVPATAEGDFRSDLTDLTADVVRAGCGKRLFFSRLGLRVSGSTYTFVEPGNGMQIRVSWDNVTARRGPKHPWSRVSGFPSALFPEFLPDEVLNRVFDPPPPDTKKPERGFLLVPRLKTVRRVLESVRMEFDSDGRPKEVEFRYVDGGREFRTYSGWEKSRSDPVPVPNASETVAWPPEAGWGSKIETVLDSLSAKVKKVESITGSYVREKRTVLLLKPFVAKGKFRFVPGRLLWMDEEPRESLVLITRKKMEVYDPENKRLERFLFGDSRMGDYVFVGFGDSASVAFRSFRPLEFARKDGVVTLRCRPVTGALLGHIDTLTLRIDSKTGLMKELSYVDPSGDSVSTKVSDVRTDRDLDEDDVALKPAKGTRIIENSGEMPWR